jgi:hypothetical protein
LELIGFSGYARSGKDTAAEALLGLGFRRMSFADKLREFVYVMNPTVSFNEITMFVKDIIDTYGWDGYKETEWADPVRKILQVVGTDCARSLLGDNIWVEAAFNNLPDGRYVFSDVRFKNEADAIKERGGRVIRIYREGVAAQSAHPSETALDGYAFDDIVMNYRTKSEFIQKVKESYENWR